MYVTEVMTTFDDRRPHGYYRSTCMGKAINPRGKPIFVLAHIYKR